jgi:hypothetical protein
MPIGELRLFPAIRAEPHVTIVAATGRAGLTDPELIGGIAEITAMIAAQLDDGASTAGVMPVIRETARRWSARSTLACCPPPQAWLSRISRGPSTISATSSAL